MINKIHHLISSEIRTPNKIYLVGSILIIALFAIIPLFFTLPFRDNIYLSWEGAYRMYKGQVPFKDFGLPLGYGFWIIPTIFFHLFGPYLSSLIKAQVFINILAGGSFLLLMEKMISSRGIKALSTLLFVLSFSFYNFWPWYNHSVIVFEFISLGLLAFGLLDKKRSLTFVSVLLFIAGFFSFLAFFTKQDGGAFSVLIAESLLIYCSLLNRSLREFIVFNLGFAFSAAILILPVYGPEFSYWFNMGQAPHSSRIIPRDFLDAIIGSSFVLKLYLLLVILIVVKKSKKDLNWIKDKKFTLHLILTLAILLQASILQVTSYVPADGNIYFHSFFFAFFVTHIGTGLNFEKIKVFIPLALMISFWWSGLYWKYINRLLPTKQLADKEIVSKSTFSIKKDTTLLNKSNWKVPDHKHFQKIKLPQECIEAIKNIENWHGTHPTSKVLNMSELTPLADILGYDLESGTPLWYHLNVAFFQNELDYFNGRIESEYYDMVIFEHIPQLNNFYPFSVREKLKENYSLWFSFQAPREKTSEVIEVYLRRDETL